MMRRWIRAVLLGSVAMAAGGATGCASERAPINRVQANALAKSFYVGEHLKDITDDPEFYMRGTVVDVGYGAAQDGLFTSTYAQPVSRIKWEITENTLNARLAYERIEGSDGKGNVYDGASKTPKSTNDGQIVASYAIQSHFDIRRDYNPTTGEESNVVVENSSDRVWNEREYMRVDWSRNLTTTAYNFDTLSQLGLYGGITYEPLSYYVNDPNSEDAPHFDPEAGYFDITTKAFATPGLVDLSSLGWGIDSFPACMLPGDFAGGTEPYGNCNPVEITLRHSFKKVVDKDYEPIDFDGLRFQSFGIFNFDFRYGYERNYGMLDNQWRRFAARYNLWERSHFYTNPGAMTGEIACATRETTEIPTGNPAADPNRDDDKNGTADECEGAGAGSRCDVFTGKCTLPFAQRKEVTIPWYIGGDSSDDLFEATNWAVQEWDLAMKTAIRSSRLVECKRTGGADCDNAYVMWKGQQDDNDEAVLMSRELDACHRAKGWESGECANLVTNAAQVLSDQRGGDPSAIAIGNVVNAAPVIVLCHNPVIKSDHGSCGAPGLAPRLGDLRYHSVLIIEKPQQPSAWGIMVDADDPLTGEKVAASINIWSHVTDLATQGLVDLVRYMNGELATSEVTDGKYIRDWAQASKLSDGATGPRLSPDEVTARLASVTKLSPRAYKELTSSGMSAEFAAALKPMKDELADVAVRNDIPSPNAAAIAARMRGMRGTPAEAELMNPAMLQIAGIPGNLPVDGPVSDAASPFSMNNPKVQDSIRKAQENALAARGACILHEAPEASALTGIADALARKFPVAAGESEVDKKARYEQMWRYLRRRYHYAVIAHEMGHSIGLRHNFVSTAASLFFRPQYWQLRTRNGEVTKACSGAANEDSSKCVGPRYYDAMTDEEQSQMLWMYQQSTVMDYPGDVSQDLIGLGAYDFAAARFFYGDTVSVYNSPDPEYLAGGKVGAGLLAATDTFGGLTGIQYGVNGAQGVTNFHYSQLQKNYKVIDNCYDITPTAPASWNAEIDGPWDQVMDGKIVAIDGVTKKCRQTPVDYVEWDDLRSPTSSETGNSFYRGSHSVEEGSGRVRVPYAFATDHWADSGNVSVFRHDNGADPYEQMMFLITTQENRHIFDNFRRGRTTFSVRGAAARSYSRYNEKLVGIAGGIGFFGTIYQDLATNQGLSFDTLWPVLVDGGLRENVISATIAFDHFTRQLSRPEDGPHYLRDPLYNDFVLHSDKDTDDYGSGTDFSSFGGNKNSDVLVVIPNGTTGYLRDVGIGGHPIENALSETNGDFDSEFTVGAGSYYDKINTAILMSESEDRFISQSRRDFYDARFRAVGMADAVPEGYRRILANALTGDRSMLAPRLEAQTNGDPKLDTGSTDTTDPDAKMYPSRPMGWTSWWPNEGPTVCFPTNGRNICTDYQGDDFNPANVTRTIPVDPQVGWEVQKFLIAWTLAYIPANGKTDWLDMMRIYRLGPDSSPAFEGRIEWQDPTSGQIYYARTYGHECLFGSGADETTCVTSGGTWAEKGIAARVLQWANHLTANGYQLDPSYCDDPTVDPVTLVPVCPNLTPPGTHAGFNQYDRAMFMSHPDHTPIIVPDPAVKDLPPTGALTDVPPCDQNVDPTCTKLTIYKNHYAYELKGYKSVPDYLWEMMIDLGLGSPDQLGVYPD